MLSVTEAVRRLVVAGRVMFPRPLGCTMRWIDERGHGQCARLSAYHIDDGHQVWVDVIGGDICDSPPEHAVFDDGPTCDAVMLYLAREALGCNEYRRLTIEPAGAGWCAILRNGRHRPPSRAQPGWDLDPMFHPRYRDVASPLGTNEFPTERAATDAVLIALAVNFATHP